VRKVGDFIILLVALSVLCLGWNLYWFLTDDAYIAFRYISNRQLGFGYVWNAPPFRAVEGYTSFLWVVILDFVWSVFGVLPPISANWIALLCSAGTIGVALWMAERVPLAGSLARIRPILSLLVVLGIASNRSFLVASSSGLETALFNFLFLAWIATGWFSNITRLRNQVLFTFLTALIALCRPDGLLHVAAVALFVVLLVVSGRVPRVKFLLASAPLLLVGMHLAWRFEAYGEWLPNTYYAKYVAPWPESGGRYLLSFVMEYVLWIWLSACVAVGAKYLLSCRDTSKIAFQKLFDPLFLRRGAVVGVLIAHFCYYTFVIGGDHFEYRVYSHLIPVFYLSLLVAVNYLFGTIRLGAVAATVVLAAQLLFAIPIPWLHWYVTQELVGTEALHRRPVALEKYVPDLVGPYVAKFDELQAWLITRLVGSRHHQHKAFWLAYLHKYPEERFEKVGDFNDPPVLAAVSVGIPGWYLPLVAVIDTKGLNDYVIARTVPKQAGVDRKMAHERFPPKGYLACFEPNVRVSKKRVTIRKRKQPLTERRIFECEVR
jgi:arabinofuranosyltransferase